MDGLHVPISDDRNLSDLKSYPDVSFRSCEIIQITTTWTTSISLNVMRWNILSVRLMKNNLCFPLFLSIRRGNVALMPQYGEKSDLALSSGMFLLRLWWVGPGRGHMKGSLCQAAKMFSLSLMKTRTHEQTWEHACHTLYEHQSYNTVDKLSIRLLFFDKVKRSISECVCCA